MEILRCRAGAARVVARAFFTGEESKMKTTNEMAAGSAARFLAAAWEMLRRTFGVRMRGVAMAQVYVLLASASLGDLRAAQSTGILPPPFVAPLHWTASDVLIGPVADAHGIVAVKDPSIVRYNDRWHIYATTANTNG